MGKRILVGISVYRDWEYLDLLLQSIHWYSKYKEDEEFDLVVCDDGTRSHDEDMANKIADTAAKYGVPFIEHPRNMGIPTTWNHLCDSFSTDSEIIVLLNNDIIVPPNWLRVAVHFLDANKDNPQVGTCFWNPVNRVPKETMRNLLPLMGHTTFITQDVKTGEPLNMLDLPNLESRVGQGQGLGRVMCPCGPCFAFRRDVWNIAGPFNEAIQSFHEESWFGTTCAKLGRASFGFAYPRPYHTHGASFAANPELEHSRRMTESRKMYREAWGVPPEIPDGGPGNYFDYVNERLMSKIPLTSLKYLRPDYDQEPEVRTLVGGEEVELPRLIEFEEEF